MICSDRSLVNIARANIRVWHAWIRMPSRLFLARQTRRPIRNRRGGRLYATQEERRCRRAAGRRGGHLFARGAQAPPPPLGEREQQPPRGRAARDLRDRPARHPAPVVVPKGRGPRGGAHLHHPPARGREPPAHPWGPPARRRPAAGAAGSLRPARGRPPPPARGGDLHLQPRHAVDEPHDRGRFPAGDERPAPARAAGRAGAVRLHGPFASAPTSCPPSTGAT